MSGLMGGDTGLLLKDCDCSTRKSLGELTSDSCPVNPCSNDGETRCGLLGHASLLGQGLELCSSAESSELARTEQEHVRIIRHWDRPPATHCVTVLFI